MKTSYHHGELRTALLDAALKGLEEDGVLPSWRALARACTVSHTAPYRHFQNFESLQTAAAAECFRRLKAAILLATEKTRDPFNRLARGLAAYCQFGHTHPSWYELMFGPVSAVARDVEMREAGAAAFATLVEAIAACGVNRPADHAATVWCALHGVTDLARQARHAPASLSRSYHAADAVIAMCLAHVRAAAH